MLSSGSLLQQLSNSFNGPNNAILTESGNTLCELELTLQEMNRKVLEISQFKLRFKSVPKYAQKRRHSCQELFGLFREVLINCSATSPRCYTFYFIIV